MHNYITVPPCQVHELGDHGLRGLRILVDLLSGTVTVSVGGTLFIGDDSLLVSGSHSILVRN